MKKYFTLPFLFLAFSLFAEDAQPARSNNYIQTLVMLGVVLVFFYFILLRPEQKRRKKSLEMRNAMKKGDRVTAMGMIGTIDKVNENTVIIKAYDGAKIEMLKAAITEVQPQGQEAPSNS
jgi:preprotein translocase subunit YajC